MNAKPNILVIDDEEVVRMSLERVLHGAECNVEVASSGTAGLSVMDRKPVDVVLLDLRLPGMGGVEVLEQIKRHWPRTEVIVITGYPATETVKEAIRLGAYDYLAKPLGPDEVISVANAAVQHKRFALQRLAAE
jgi:DNA-binding NtrC family response regulator